MMQSQIQELSYPNGEIQRFQVVRLESWDALEPVYPRYSEKSFESFCNIYRRYLVPGCPWVFGNIVLFRLPEGAQIPAPFTTEAYGTVADPLTAAAALLRRDVRVRGEHVRFRSQEAKGLWQMLEKQGCLQTVRGKLPATTIIPVGNTPGFLSETEKDARMKVNGAFFIMDPFDCATPYDHVGTVIGLQVKDGVIDRPPLFSREALLVRKDGSISIDRPELTDLRIEIGGVVYIPGTNATIYSRPDRARTPGGRGVRLVIVGRRVAAVCHGGRVPIPASGFVLCPEGECHAVPGDPVTYRGLEDVRFGIQVGNSIVRDGVKTETFLSRFYNIRRLERVPYPPCLYPMDFEKARAARIALGADAEGRPMILWAEGAGKLGYIPGKDSCGASLSEMAHICAQAGMVNAVNLDGGGSAQMLLHNCRSLKISDRDDKDHSESERPVPMGLMAKS